MAVSCKSMLAAQGLKTIILRNLLSESRHILLFRCSYPALHAINNQRDYTSFVSRATADSLWDSVTGVSNAGRKRGRGRNAKKRQNFNFGQIIGHGKEGMKFPGLTGPSLQGNKRIEIYSVHVTGEADPKRLLSSKKKMARVSALLRGYSGRKFPGTSIGRPDPINDYEFVGFDTRVLEYKMVSHMTGNLGRKMRVSSCVVTGNRNGLAGYAVGKAPMGKAAVRKAKNMAAQRLQYIERYHGHTVFHNFAVREGYTTVFVQKMPKGYGLDCHRVIKTLCQIIGIEDLHVKVEGSTSNVQNMIKAFFRGLMEQESHQQLADRMQLHVVEYRQEMENIPLVMASPQQGHTREEPFKEEAFDFDNLYYKDGKISLKKVKDPLAPLKSNETSWKHYLMHDRDRNQIEARFLRMVHDLEPSLEELKERMRPLK